MTARAASAAVGAARDRAGRRARRRVRQTPLYHRWQYALVLAIALVAIVAYANGARRGDDGVAGRRLSLAHGRRRDRRPSPVWRRDCSAPIRRTSIGTPGTVTPIPALGAAAFFGAGRRRHDRRRVARASSCAGAARARSRSARPRAACWASRSCTSRRAPPRTSTCTTSTARTSPSRNRPTRRSSRRCCCFRDRQRIGALDVPFDTFAAPARHRVRARAVLHHRAIWRRFDHGGARFDASRPALILTVADDRGRPIGITLAPSGRDVAFAGLRMRATIGTYPALAIASAPPTLGAGRSAIALFVAGLGSGAALARQAARERLSAGRTSPCSRGRSACRPRRPAGSRACRRRRSCAARSAARATAGPRRSAAASR